MRRAAAHLGKKKEILRTDQVARALAAGLERGDSACQLWQVADSLGITESVEKELEIRSCGVDRDTIR